MRAAAGEALAGVKPVLASSRLRTSRPRARLISRSSMIFMKADVMKSICSTSRLPARRRSLAPASVRLSYQCWVVSSTQTSLKVLWMGTACATRAQGPTRQAAAVRRIAARRMGRAECMRHLERAGEAGSLSDTPRHSCVNALKGAGTSSRERMAFGNVDTG
jgi:hypothetical protein